MKGPVTMIAVIGPVEPALLTAWCEHYRGLGVDDFAIALHAPDETSKDRRAELVTVLREHCGKGPLVLADGPWHEQLNSDLRDRLRAHVPYGWHLLADADEFQHHPGGLSMSIATVEAGNGVLGGILLDRLAADGGFPRWSPEVGLDQTYPLGGLLTHYLLRGDPRKIVLTHPSVPVASGNHRAPGYRPPAGSTIPVHHFKWRHGVEAELRTRVRHFTTGTWRETTPAVRTEAQRLLDHLDAHLGRVDVTGDTVGFTPVTLDRLPSWWRARVLDVVQGWSPPHSHSETG
ncbi:glycosyltransferase family 2 protein [Saccharopolyspora hattusasensis]|uniref:glycosyltransferase family 2 protein n=1 Tax=Saccharopolyspora hattusasensis TaxID=1128679 RepID=UPI003D966F3E